nr:kelch repeat-containing protein [Myxococcales bacterium]
MTSPPGGARATNATQICGSDKVSGSIVDAGKWRPEAVEMLRFVGSRGPKAWGFMGGAAAIALLCAGCPDSLTLEPVSSSSGPGGTGGSGGGTPAFCNSNPDCAAPKAVCDVVRHECVECLELAHCSATMPGTVCSQGACVCPAASDTYCPGSKSCADVLTSVSNCGACGHECYGACNEGKCADGWERTPMLGAPAPRASHVAVGTDTKMIVWGGVLQGNTPTSTGGVLDMTTGTWTKTSESNVPPARSGARAIWTGTQMVVWGGMVGATAVNTGGVYNPNTNTWTPMSTEGAPQARYGHTMVWAGAPISKVLVWGGHDSVTYFGDGFAYDVASNTWTTLSTAGTPPIGRMEHAAVWNGQRMLIWGGYGPNNLDNYLADGAEFDPSDAGVWTSLVVDGQPAPRTRPTAVWNEAGKEMIVWGGAGPGGPIPTGGRYEPATGLWKTMPSEGAPEARQYHTAILSGGRFIVWGGVNGAGVPVNSGALYDPVNNKWKAMPTAPQARANHTAVDVGGKMVIWGGSNSGNLVDTGGIFDPASAL